MLPRKEPLLMWGCGFNDFLFFTAFSLPVKFILALGNQTVVNQWETSDSVVYISHFNDQILLKWQFFAPSIVHILQKFVLYTRGGTQYKSGYRDVPQTWVAKSGRQVHQWVPFFSKTWYFDGSIFQNFLKFAPKWRKFGTLIGQLFKIFRNLRQNGANFSEKF